jgi:predicted ArsR family transcriptional regulator
VSILEVLSIDEGRTLSPKDLSLELQAPLSTVNYHVTELRHSGLVGVVDEQQVRGAIEHFYRVVEPSQNGSGRKRGSRKSRSKARA